MINEVANNLKLVTKEAAEEDALQYLAELLVESFFEFKKSKDGN